MKKNYSVVIFLLIFFSKCVDAQLVPSMHLLFIKKTVVDESRIVFTNSNSHIQPISDSLIIVWSHPSNAGLYNYQTGELKYTYNFNNVNMDSIIANIIQPVFLNRKYLTGNKRNNLTNEFHTSDVDWFWFNKKEIIRHVNYLTPYFETTANKNENEADNIFIQFTSSLVTTDIQGRIIKIKWFVGEDELNCGFFLGNGYFYKNNILYAFNDTHFNLENKFQDYDLSEKFKFLAIKTVNKSVMIDTSMSKNFLHFENKVPDRYWSLRMMLSNTDSVVGDGVGLYYTDNLIPINENF